MTSSTHPSVSSSPPASARLAASSTVGGADHLVVDGVSKAFADRRVLTDVSFTVASGERACLIGENGTGKTTLLRIIAGLDDDHAGRISAPGSIGLYHQQPAFDLGLSVAEVLAEATAPQRRLVDEVTRLAEALAAEEAPEPDAGPERPGATSPNSAVLFPSDSPASAAGSEADARLASAYDRALAEATRTHAWDIDHVTDRMVEGLGLAGVGRDRAAEELSGGQLSRLSLAWLLLRRPDTLLLDEPTNHLDDRGTALLVDLLTGWSGPVLIASHDRAFLDETATTLLDLDAAPRLHRDVLAAGRDGAGRDGAGRNGAGRDGAGRDGAGRNGAADTDVGDAGVGVTRFGGTYTQYLLHRIDERARWERRYRQEQEELRRLRRQVSASHTVGHADRPPRTEGKMAQKFYSDRNATVVRRRVNDAATALARLEDAQVRKPPPVLRFAGLAAATGATTATGTTAATGATATTGAIAVTGSGGPVGPSGAELTGRADRPASSAAVLVATDVALAGRLARVSVALGARSRLLVTGPNGAGKTTLLRILGGDLEPDAGSVTAASGRSGGLSVGMLGQEPAPMDPDAIAAEAYRAAVGPERAEGVPLGMFGLLTGRDERQPVGALSVGQRRRLDLAMLLADPPEVLLLDEPTNHFSLLLATRLEASIADYPGAVVVASHDRWLRSGWRGERLELNLPSGAGN